VVAELLGLIAGDGDFPLEIARAARRGGRRIHAVGFHGLTRTELDAVADEITWLHLGEVGALLDELRGAGVADVVMAGTVDKTHLHGVGGGLHLDARARSLLAELPDHRDASILGLLAGALEESGMALRSQAEWVPHLVLGEGALGALSPTQAQWRDIRTGWPIARRNAADEVGQCVVVKDGAVVAVEAMEGTDATIDRAAGLAGAGTTVVKAARPRQDPRFDLPVIGAGTLGRLIDARAGALAVEAGTTVVLDREEVIHLADQHGIALVGVAPAGPDEHLGACG
jgi:DUF1009 family protein